MSLFKSLALTAACLGAFSVASFADTISGATPFATLSTANIANNGGEFFDNVSDDGASCGIGWILTGTNPAGCSDADGNIAGPPPLPTGDGIYSYMTSASGFQITPAANSFSETTLYIELAGARDGQRVGWTTDNGATVNWLTSGAAAPNPQYSTIITTSPFQFVVDLGSSRQLSNGTGSNRFALFALNSQFNAGTREVYDYVVGFEDGQDARNNGFGDLDYNDIILRVKVVPEPATVTALGAAVLATIVAVRRRRKA